MLAASMAVGHLFTATEREPPRPPHRHQARLAPGTTRMALSYLRGPTRRRKKRLPPRGPRMSNKTSPRNAWEAVVL